MSCRPGWTYKDGAFKDCTGRCLDQFAIAEAKAVNVTSAEDEDESCCKYSTCRFRNCRSWFAGGIDPNEVEARKLAKESVQLALQEIKNASEAETRERGPVGGEVALIVAEEKVRRDKLAVEANMTGLAPNGTYIPGTAWFDQPEYHDNHTFKAPPPPQAELDIFGPDAISTINNRTGELNIAYNKEGYPKPWDNPGDSKVVTGTNLDPDPAKYNETDNHFNPVKVAKRKAARLAADAAAVAAVKAALSSSNSTLELGDGHDATGAEMEDAAAKPKPKISTFKKLNEEESIAQQMKALPPQMLADSDLSDIFGAAHFEVGPQGGDAAGFV